MRAMRLLMILAVAVVLAPGLALADCSEAHGKTETTKAAAHECSAAHAAKAGHECGENCAECGAKVAKAMKLAEKAEGGCQASSAALIAMAKESGHEKAIALAEQAEGGCEHSKAALIAMVREMHGESASLATLARNAKGGCAASEAKLIQMAKASEDKKVADLAERAAGGCEHSKAALIAMVADEEKSETE